MYKEDEEMEKVGYCSFFIPCTLSLAASILRYSSTSSTGVSSFFFDVLGVLFFCVSIQGAEGPAPTESGLV